jgi:hypothetical protein
MYSDKVVVTYHTRTTYRYTVRVAVVCVAGVLAVAEVSKAEKTEQNESRHPHPSKHR